MVSGHSLVRQNFVSLCRFPSLDCLFRIVVTSLHYRPSGPKWGWLPTTKSSFHPLTRGRQTWQQVSSSVSKRFRSEFAFHNCDYMFFCFRLYFIPFSHAPYQASHHVVSATGFYSFVFDNRGIFGLVYVRCWMSTSLVRVYLCRYRLTSEPTAGILNSISGILSAFSSKPNMVSVSGCTVEVVHILDRRALFQQGIQYPFQFSMMSFPMLKHHARGSVFGKIDIFSQVKFLLGILDGCHVLPWIALIPTFVQVSILDSLYFVGMLTELTLSPTLLCLIRGGVIFRGGV